MESPNCRLCSDRNVPMIGIFSEEDIERKISSYLSLEVRKDDGLSTSICILCYGKLDNFHKFVVNVHKVQEEMTATIEIKEIFFEAINLESEIYYDDETEMPKDEIKSNMDTDFQFIVANMDELQENASFQMCKSSIDLPSASEKQDYIDLIDISSDDDIEVDDKSSDDHPNPCLEDSDQKDDRQVFAEDWPSPPKKRLKTVTERGTLLGRNYEKGTNSNISTTISSEITEEIGSISAASNSVSCPVINREQKTEKMKSFTCELCGKKFIHKGTLGQHMLVHTKEKPFQCKFEGCNKQFSRKFNLEVHVGIHDEIGSKVKSYKCPLIVCQTEFNEAVHLYRHICSHIGKGDIPAKIQRFLNSHKITLRDCDECGKKFYDKQDLKRHELSHTGKKPFACAVKGCDRKFSRKGHLKRHMPIHEGNNELECPLSTCCRTFVRKEVLLRHLCIHLNEKGFRVWNCC